MNFFHLIACITLVIGIVYGAHKLQRWAHWELAYEAKVIDTIEKTVKRECLK